MNQNGVITSDSRLVMLVRVFSCSFIFLVHVCPYYNCACSMPIYKRAVAWGDGWAIQRPRWDARDRRARGRGSGFVSKTDKQRDAAEEAGQRERRETGGEREREDKDESDYAKKRASARKLLTHTHKRR
jgi:hypothetical protein